jgi:hypothetical protein
MINLEERKQWNKIVARAWSDEDFKQRLISDPASVLEENGITVPEGVNVQVKEASRSDGTLILPPKPEGYISDYEDPAASVYDDTFYSIF